MCTVVMDVRPTAVRFLAVRDEDPERPWDDLGAWWPETYPGVIGIRDRRAGGAWFAYDPASGRQAVLLNREDSLSGERPSRGSLVLESVSGRSPQTPQTHGFNLVEIDGSRARVTSWDGEHLRTIDATPGVHMIAHDDLDDPATARVAAWLAPFSATDFSKWTALLQRTTELGSDDDRAIIRDNRPHGYPTQSLLFLTSDGEAVQSTILTTPGHWGSSGPQRAG